MNIRPLIGLILVLLLVSIPLFTHLDDNPLMIWDESRLANSAIEMYETGNYLVVSYDYAPEMWSTKPPLMIWLQVISLKLFGINDIAFRLPTVLSALFTCVFLFWFFDRKLKIPWLGILSSLILVTIHGYVTLHGTRTGDYDVTLILFMTMSICYFYLYIEHDTKKYLWLTFICLTLAFLTKSIASILFTPGMALYCLYKKKLFSIIKTKHFYLGALMFIICVGGYYLLREQYNPGYIKAVMENEWGGRYNNTLEGEESRGFLYYYNLLTDWYLHPWYILVPLGLVAGLFSKNQQVKDITIMIFVTFVTFYLVISTSSTKLPWYVQPSLPLLSILVAILLYSIMQALYYWKAAENIFTLNVFPYLFLAIVLINPYVDRVQYALNHYKHRDSMGATEMAVILKGYMHHYPYKERMHVFYEGYHSVMKWYIKSSKHHNLPIINAQKDSIGNNEFAIAYEGSAKDFIKQAYIVHEVSNTGDVTLYQIHGRKPQNP